MTKITAPQLKRIQVLYAQFAARSFGAGNSREERIAWASEQLGRTIKSFSDLSFNDAHTLIDQLQGTLGVKAPSTRRRMSRRDAEKAATEGRHDQKHAEITVASASDIARVQRGIKLLGWDQTRFDAWLRSARSPLATTVNGVRVAPANPKISTLGEANKVWWALKRMAKHQGQGKD